MWVELTGLWAANYNDAEGSFWIREFCVLMILSIYRNPEGSDIAH